MRCPPIPIESGIPAAAQSDMPSIALPCRHRLCRPIHDGAALWPYLNSQISTPIDRCDRLARLSLLSDVSAIGRPMMGSEG